MNISNNMGVDSNDLAKRGESLIRKSTNRYLTTVRIAFRAKQRRFDDFDGLLEESTIKPVQRSIIELSDEQDQPDLLPGQLTLVKHQKRWRLLRDFKKGKFCFLIAVDNWSIELQKNEFYSLYLLLLKINEQLLVIKNELMDEESISIELEKLPWYIELEGKKEEWSLRLIFESQEQTRSFEMYWPIPIAQNLFYEIKKMWESMD